MPYLVAYDVAEPKRLRRVARLMERVGLRLQKSVFYLAGGPMAAQAALALVRPVLREDEDVIQAWRLGQDESPLGMALGVARPLGPAAVVVAGGPTRWVEEPARAGRKPRGGTT